MDDICVYEIKTLKKQLNREEGKLKDIINFANMYRETGKEPRIELLKRAGVKNEYMKITDKIVKLEHRIRALESIKWTEKGIRTQL